ncbi:hypothetical protein DMUE_4583 [Dictyocoela muelleri]|nr:hypothetical protein DMUE_4583 [Dictyocoela muelleri]
MKELIQINFKIKYAKGLSKSESKNLLDNFFFLNLSKHTSIYIQEKEISSCNEAFEILKKLEEIIFSNSIRNDVNYPPKTFKIFDNKNKDKNKNNTSKWCDFHKLSSHNNSECYKQNELNDIKDLRKSQNNAIISTEASYTPEAKATINDNDKIVLFDSGSEKTYIKARDVTKDSVILLKNSEKFVFVIADGSKKNITKYTRIVTTFQSITNVKFKI